MTAYKDLEESQCYLERMKGLDGGVKHHMRQVQPHKLRDKARTVYVSDNNLSKYEVSKRRN
jgi:hypothetical protein